jgi:hypothetical protein|tara:strand:- start:5407 stop:5718 length:312 start_codon:yes stop_codon:yes gene_type:complete
MGSPSKNKGSKFERDCVKIAKEYGLEAKRAWGSDGRSLGMEPEVDLVVDDYKVQCKIRKRIAKWILPEQMVDIQLIRENYGEAYVIQPYDKWLEMVKRLRAQT